MKMSFWQMIKTAYLICAAVILILACFGLAIASIALTFMVHWSFIFMVLICPFLFCVALKCIQVLEKI